jgi:hypothetical protein
MKAADIIKQAQIISGIGVFEGNAEDVNFMSSALAIFHSTLCDINSDPKITLWQQSWDYQSDAEGGTQPVHPSGGSGGWIDIPQLAPGHSEPPAAPPADARFPGMETPFPVSSSYPLPADCRRVVKAFTGATELRKTDFSEVVKARKAAGGISLFAVNCKRIELACPGRLLITYAKQFKPFMPQDDADLPPEADSYVVNALACNLALAFNKEAADRTRMLAEKSYNALTANMAANAGEQYQSIYAAMSRFSGRGGHWL